MRRRLAAAGTATRDLSNSTRPEIRQCLSRADPKLNPSAPGPCPLLWFRSGAGLDARSDSNFLVQRAWFDADKAGYTPLFRLQLQRKSLCGLQLYIRWNRAKRFGEKYRFFFCDILFDSDHIFRIPMASKITFTVSNRLS